jgi:hypothetical protein
MAASEVITDEPPRSRILDGRITDTGRRPQETNSAQGRFEDVHRGGYDPEQHLKDMALDVRHDLLRRLRASSPPHTGHCRVRAGVGAAPALHHGLYLPRAPRRGDLPVQELALAKAGGLPPRRRGTAWGPATSSAATFSPGSSTRGHTHGHQSLWLRSHGGAIKPYRSDCRASGLADEVAAAPTPDGLRPRLEPSRRYTACGSR